MDWARIDRDELRAGKVEFGDVVSVGNREKGD